MQEREFHRLRQGPRKEAHTSDTAQPRLMTMTNDIVLRPRTQERELDQRRQGVRKKALSESPSRRGRQETSRHTSSTVDVFDESSTFNECYFLASDPRYPAGSSRCDAQAPTSANKTRRSPSPSPATDASRKPESAAARHPPLLGPVSKTRRSSAPARRPRTERARSDSGIQVLRILFEKCALTCSVSRPIASNLRNEQRASGH